MLNLLVRILRFLKNHPDVIYEVKDCLLQHGFRETLKRTKAVNAKQQQLIDSYAQQVDGSDKQHFFLSSGVLAEPRLKIAVLIHVVQLDRVQEIFEYLTNIPCPYSLYLSVSESLQDELQELISSREVSCKLIVTPEHLDDISAFFFILPELLSADYDLVCKIHTQQLVVEQEEGLPDIEQLCFKLALNSVLGSRQSIGMIINAFQTHDDLAVLGAAELYQSAQKQINAYETVISQLLNVLDEHFDPAQEWGSFAGNIFWARLDIFQVFNNNQAFANLLQNHINRLSVSRLGFFGALQSIIGAVPKISNMSFGLVYATDVDRKTHALQILSNYNAYLRINIDVILQNEYALLKNLHFIQQHDEFDAAYYLQQAPICRYLAMDALLHFLRYGVLQNYAPNENFSPFAYWSLNPHVLHQGLNPFIHYLNNINSEVTIFSMPAENNDALACAYIKKSGLFDAKYYLKENTDVADAGINPLLHYCQYGWREERQPSFEFDALWYQDEYLVDFLSPVNPLLHYLLFGKQKGFSSKALVERQLSYGVEVFPKQPKRICLFAAYDADGLIDETIVSYVKELARFADVYLLADAVLQDGQLQKLIPYVKGSWGIEHGEYDFGSYMRLAKYFVGWDVIAQYDELLLVNDSSYLLRPLDDVFSKMHLKSCSWWGMQASKGTSATEVLARRQFPEKVAIETVKTQFLSDFELDKVYDFHIGSYFLAFRKPVLESGELQKLLNSVKKENNKKAIVFKYEIGLTRRLINKGYDFDTFINDLYPFHPLYSHYQFELIADGFPLFKRFLLTENHYRVPELWRWKERLDAVLPGVNTELIEQNLLRVADAGKLYNNLHIQETPVKLLSRREFKRRDKKVKQDMYCWAFPVCAFDHSFSGNERAVFEEIKNNPQYTKVILIRSKQVQVDGVKLKVVPLESREGQQYLLQSGVIFIKHTPKVNVIYELDPKRHKFINLWHGIPLKRIGVASLDHMAKIEKIASEQAKCHCVIASSAVDRLAMASAFYPLTYNDIWVTGLPRNDFILREEAKLPEDFRRQLENLRKMLRGQRFMLFVPTFRNAQQGAYYRFSRKEKNLLFAFLEANHIILGIREHMADKALSYSSDLNHAQVIKVDSRMFPNIEVLYREASLLITDYSSCFFDFMLTGKPMLSFAYDYEHYLNIERGLFYDMQFAFPGLVCQDFNSLIKAMANIFSADMNKPDESYQLKRKIFFDYVDDRNASRLVAKVNKDINENNSEKV